MILGLLATRAHADILCDGTDDKLTNASTMGTFFSSSGWTVMMVLKAGTNTFATTDCYDGSSLVLDGGVNFFIMGRGGTSGNQACVYMWDDVPVSNTPAGTMATNAWHHMAVTWATNTLTVYVDGVSVATDSTSTIATYMGNNPLQVCDTGRAFALDRLACLKTFNVALTANEIASLAQSKTCAYERRTPTAMWRFDNCTDGANANGVAMRDVSGNGRNLTADDGANNTGMTCRASESLTLPWGPN